MDINSLTPPSKPALFFSSSYSIKYILEDNKSLQISHCPVRSLKYEPDNDKHSVSFVQLSIDEALSDQVNLSRVMKTLVDCIPAIQYVT